MGTKSASVVALCLATLCIGCGKDSVGPSAGGRRIALSGRVVSAGPTVAAAAPSSRSVGGAPVRKVLVYRDFGEADVVPVDSSGRFTVQVDRKACGLVFLDASDQVVGYLSLASGISTLPLMMVDSTVAQLDLSNITIQDSVGTPAHDPLGAGGEAQMTPEELEAYRLQSSLFSAIVRNLDMNHDGVLDVLSSRPYWIGFGADFDGGLAPTSDPGAAGPLPVLNVFHFGFSDYTLNAGTPAAVLVAPDTRSFTAPFVEANPYTVIRNGEAVKTATMYHWVLQNTSWDAFQTGPYTITYDAGGPLTFNVVDPLNATNYIVAAHFWYEASGGKVTRVHWKWEMLDGRPIEASRLLQSRIQLGLQYPGLVQVTHNDVTSADAVHDVDADTTGLLGVMLWATDLFGNNLITNYRMR